MIYLIFSQLMRHPLIKLFHHASFLQMPNNSKMADTEFFGNFSCSCKKISFDDPLSWSLSTSDGRPLYSSSSRLSSSLQNFFFFFFFTKLLEPPPYYTSVSSSWAKCVVDIASYLCCFTTHFELK